MEQRWKFLRLFFFDFDQTLTRRDVCTRIPTIVKTKEREEIVKNIAKQFEEKHLEVWNKYIPVLRSGTDWKKSLQEFMSCMDEVEIFGVNLAEENRILEGVTKNQLREFADIVKNDNVKDEYVWKFLHKYFESRKGKSYFPLYCVSTNWSFDAIESGISSIWRQNNVGKERLRILPIDYPQVQKEVLFTKVPTVYIFSNDLEFDNGKSTGIMQRKCITSYDKKKFTQTVRQAVQTFTQDFDCIFIGDGLPDCLPIIEGVDHGVIMETGVDNRPEWLNLFLKQFPEHISCKKFKEFPVQKEKDVQLYETNTWKDLYELEMNNNTKS
jgi:phosphoserine phosphatase